MRVVPTDESGGFQLGEKIHFQLRKVPSVVFGDEDISAFIFTCKNSSTSFG